MKWKEVLSRLTGLGCPAFGVSWNPPESDSAVAQRVVAFLEVVKRLEKAGAGMPKGRLCHASFGDENNLQVFDIWESQETFAKFGETLLPIMAAIGYQPPTPMFSPVHNIIVGG